MKVIGKIALSLILPTLITINVYGEETSTTTPTTTGGTPKEGCPIPPQCPPDPIACCSEDEPTTTETPTTIEESPQGGCPIPPQCPPDPIACCSEQ